MNVTALKSTPKLIVGLGNPGRRYSRTRHNLGFLVVDELAHRWGLRFRRKLRNGAATAGGGPYKVVLAKPLKFMNLSGPPVRQVARRLGRLEPTEILVVVDDLDLPSGVLRLRYRGSSSGHRGLQSVASTLGTTDFPRLRIGIGPCPPDADPAEFVLAAFAPVEHAPAAVRRAASCIEYMLENGIEKTMEKFNKI